MKKTTGGDPLARAVEIANGCEVAVVGCVARTWYTDIEQLDRLLELMDVLCEHGLRVAHAQQLPFDDHVERLAAKHGIDQARCRAPVRRAERIASLYARPVAMLERVGLVIAFPREDSDFFSADPVVMLQAVEDQLPILVVRREGMELIEP